MSINLEDAKDAERLANYLRTKFKDGITPEEVTNPKILATYISKNSKRGLINEEDIKDINKLCTFINRITR